jgi:hypothetical protein
MPSTGSGMLYSFFLILVLSVNKKCHVSGFKIGFETIISLSFRIVSENKFCIYFFCSVIGKKIWKYVFPK